MHIFDAFCGLGPWQQRDTLLPYTAEDTLKLMDHFGIAEALVYANAGFTAMQPPGVNDLLLDHLNGSPRFTPALFLSHHVHAGYPDADGYLATMRAAGAKAAWLSPGNHCGVGGLWPWQIGDLLEMLIAHRIPLFLSQEKVNPNDLHSLLTDFPRLRVVFTSIGYTADAAIYPLVKRHANLHICLGHYYIPPEDPMRFVDTFGAERLLFGSGLPHFSPGGLIGHVMYADMPDDRKALILAGNLQRLLAEVTI